MTAFDALGKLAAECDLQHVRHPNQGYDMLAARFRKEQVACLEPKRSKQWHENEDQAAYLRGWGRA